MADLKFTSDSRVVLTETEYDMLQSMVSKGDRAGLYLAYYAMTGNSEALLTAKVSTFSETIGGLAFAANWLLQDQYRSAPPPGSDTYQGIYFLSQKVAESMLAAVRTDMDGTDPGTKSDGVSDGLINRNRLFISLVDAWKDQSNELMFPGNFPIAQGLYDIPGFSAAQAYATPGYDASVRALLYAGFFGKTSSDMAGATIVDGPDGFRMALSSSGRVAAVFGNTTQDAMAMALLVAQIVVAAWNDASPLDRADPIAFVTRVVTEAGGIAAFGVAGWAHVKDLWAAELPNLLDNARRMAGLGPDDPLTDLSAIRAKFSEFSGGYTGDVNPNVSNPAFADPTLTWSPGPTDGNDVINISIPDPVDGGQGNDLIFGSAVKDTIHGGVGNDVIWGKNGADKLFGDAGDDVLRGGAKNDTLSGGAGNDVLSGGDLTNAPVRSQVAGVTEHDGFDTADYRTAAGKVVIDLTQPGSFDVANRMFKVQQDGDGGSDTLHSIEKVFLTSGKDEVTMSAEANKLGIQFRMVGGDNIIYNKPVTESPPASLLPSAGGADGAGTSYVFTTKDDDGVALTASTRQEIFIDPDYDSKAANAQWLYVDGKQLVGGATFDFDKFDMVSSGNVLPIWLMKLARAFPAVATDNQVARWLDQQVSAATAFFKGINQVLPGVNQVPMGPLLGFSFAPILFGALAHFKESWIDAYVQVTLGTLGERYDKVRTGVDDNGQDVFDLTITLNQNTTNNITHTVVIHGWQQDDFGIHLVDTGWRTGLDTGTNKNGQIDTWQNLSLDAILAELTKVGINPGTLPPDPDDSGAAPPGTDPGGGDGPPPPIVRNGNEQDNVLAGNTGDDVLRGNEGDDELSGGDGRDIYLFGAGDGADVIDDASPDGNVIRFLDGIDVASITKTLVAGDNGEQDLLISYGAGDTILIKHWSTLSAEQQARWTFESVTPTISSPDSEDTPDLSVEPDLSGGVAKTVITGTSGTDMLAGVDIDEDIDGLDGNDTIDAGSGNDDILAGAGNDTVDGGTGNDVIRGDDGNDVLHGGDGNDQITDGAGDDVIAGGRGDDHIFASDGHDTVLFERGDGKDTIETAFGADTLQLGAGITPHDIIISRGVRLDDNVQLFGDITLSIAGTDDRINFSNIWFIFGDPQFDWNAIGPGKVVFQNGIEWTRDDLHRLYLAGAGTAAADTILGFAEDDVLQGRGGNDLLVGFAGSDTYVWNRGDGNDRIRDTEFNTAADVDRLMLGVGIAASDVSFSGPSSFSQSRDLVITIGGANGGTLTIENYFSRPSDGIEKIVLADGTVWTRADIDQKYLASLQTGGDDQINGPPSAIVLAGGAGNDTIIGNDSAAVLDGGVGNDRLESGAVYRFGASFGQDTVFDNGPLFGDPVPPFPDGGPGHDRIVFTAYDLADFDIARGGAGNNDVILSRIGATDKVTIEHFMQWSGLIENFQFADGTVVSWTDILAMTGVVATAIPSAGTAGSDTLTGTSGSDAVKALAGDDVVNAGDGSDLVNGGDGNDQLNGEAGNDILIGGAGIDAISGGDGNDLMFGGAGNDALAGDAGTDSLVGGSGDDTLAGGSGNDTLTGGADSDTYVFNRGDGQDVVQAAVDRALGEIETLSLGGGITAGELQYAFDGNDLLITFAATAGDQIRVKEFLGAGALSSIVIGATTLSLTQILDAATGATSGADTRGPVPTGSGTSMVYGGRGNDTLTGNTDNNTFVFNKGDGQDRLISFNPLFDYSDDRLMLVGYGPNDVRLARAGSDGLDLAITFTSGSDRIDITWQLADSLFHGIDGFRFEDGTAWSAADIAARVLAQAVTVGNDTILGFNGDDVMTGGAGNDALTGGTGSDRYLFNSGDGQDTIVDTGTDSRDTDTLVLGAGARPANVVVTRSVADANDAVITLSPGNGVTLKGVFADALTGVDRIAFADGTTWSKGDLATAAAASRTTAGADAVTGTFLAETLAGGAGDDTLSGGGGGDAYLFSRGDGQDTIVDTAADGIDRLVLGSTITAAQASLRRSTTDPNDLIVDLGSGDTVTVKGQLAGGAGGLEEIRFADGTAWGRVDIDQKLMAAAQTSGADIIAGSILSDRITAGTGNDTIDGRGGADIYVFNRGDGQDTIADSGSGIAQDRIELGPNIGAGDIDLSHGTTNPNDLVIAIRGTTDRIVVANHFAAGGAKIGEIILRDGTALFADDIARLAANHAPVVQSPLSAQSAAQNAAFGFAVPAGVFADSDAGDALTLTATRTDGSALPAWLQFDGTTFTGTPGNSDVGVLHVRVVAADRAGDVVTHDFDITIGNVNDAPVSTQSIANQRATVGSAFSFQLAAGQFVDPDNGLPGVPAQTITLTATLGSGAALPSWLTFNAATGTFSGTPLSANQGALDIVVTASDGTASASTHFGIFVGNSGNTAPTVGTAMGTQSATEDTPFAFQVPANAFADTTPGDRLRYSATLSNGAALPVWLTLDPVSGQFSGTPANGDVGQITVKVTALDVFGASATANFVLQVGNVNDAPTATAPLDSFVVNEDTLLTYTIPTGLFVDADAGDQLDLVAILADGSALPAWLHFDAATRTFSGTPDDPDVGMIHVVVTASDQSAAQVQKDMYILVNPVNDAPVVVHPLEALSVARGEAVSFTVPPGTFADDGGGVSLTAHLVDGTGLPSWLSFDPLTRRFSGTPDFSSVGDNEGVHIYRIAVVATDSDGAATTTIFNLAVRGPNPGALLLGSEGNDTLLGTLGPDTIIGLGGDDQMQGREGVDIYVLDRGFGHDTIRGRYIDQSGNEISTTNDVIAFGEGISPTDITVQLVDSSSGSDIFFNIHDPTLIASFYRSDILLTLAASGNSVRLQYQQRDDRFQNFQHTIEQVRFADGTVWTAADLTNRLAVGGAGDDLLAGDQSNNVLTGGAGNDRLVAQDGNDTLVGGSGNDDLYGGDGDDAYIFNLGDGDDRIVDAMEGMQAGGVDTLRFGAGIRPEDLLFTRDMRDPYNPGVPDAGSLLVEIAGTSDSIRLYHQYQIFGDVSGGIDRFAFADGTVLTRLQIDELVNPGNQLQGTDAAETITGTAAGERIIGRKGDDRLQGNDGNDTYVWNLGDGSDTISEYQISSFDVLEFGIGVRPQDISPQHFGGQAGTSGSFGYYLYLTVAPTNETITIEWEFKRNQFGQYVPAIDEFRFADGTVWSAAYFINLFLRSTPGDDVILGFPELGDIMDGGAGNDYLAGKSGPDTYIFGRGYGIDTIADSGDSIFATPVDRIQFNNTVASTDIVISRASRLEENNGRVFDTIFAIAGTADKLVLTGREFGFDTDMLAGMSFGGDFASWSWSTVQARYFAQNITTGNDDVIGFEAAETISTGTGDDRLDGGRGTDILIGGVGNDTYVFWSRPDINIIRDNGSAADVDTLEWMGDILPGDVSVFRAANGNDLILTTSNGGTIVLEGRLLGAQYSADQIHFSDGTMWDFAAILRRAQAAPADANVVVGTAGADTLIGTALAETFDPLAGNDTIQGDMGEDVYVYRSGYGNDTIVEGSNVNEMDMLKLVDLAPSQVTALRSGNDLIIHVNSTGEHIIVKDQFTSGPWYGVEQVAFSDHTAWDREAINLTAGVGGTDGNDSLIGQFGGFGDDLLAGLGGSDTINGASGTDTAVFGGNWRDYTITYDAASQTWTLADRRAGAPDGTDTVTAVERFQFADRTITVASPGDLLNDAPTDFTVTGGAVEENAGAGAVVGTLALVDPDAGDAGTFTAVSGATDRFEIIGNEIRVKAGAVLDFESASSYQLGIRVADAAGLTFTKTVTIGLVDVDETGLIGTSGNDTLTGTAAADRLNAFGGDDVLIGGAGADTLNGGTGFDIASYSTATAGVTASLAAPAGNTGDAAGDVYSSIEGLIGSGFNDTLTGDAGANSLTGGAGNDTLDGGAGADMLVGGSGNDTYLVESAGDLVVIETAAEGTDEVRASAAAYALSANVENLTYTGSGTFAGTGNALDNVMSGGAGDDLLDGGAGNDTLIGGAGNDTYVVDAAGDVVTEAAAGGTDELRTTLASTTLGANLENLTFTGTGAFVGTGNTLDNVITGGSGADTLDGGAGSDVLIGGAGNDVYIVDTAGDVVIENPYSGIDEIRTALATYVLTGAVESLTYTGSGAFSGTGNRLDNVITSGAGNDVLDGGTGSDTLVGGAGNDLYVIDDFNDVITEAASAGTDEARVAISSYTLAANVENLTFTGTGTFAGTGNALANVMSGGAGNDALNGGAGTDTLIGGLGDDIYVVDGAGDIVTENAGEGIDEVRATAASYTLGANIEKLTFTGSGAFTGTGNALDNIITGRTGNDTLDGGAGNDTLTGGTGNDSYVVDSTGDVLVENASAGTDTVRTTLASFTLAVNFENLTFIGSGNFTGTGNAANNVLTGSAGNDTLDGGTGNDTLVGGTGNDLYLVDAAADVITEAASAGTDEVRTAIASYTVGANVENLTYTGTGNFAGTGSAVANVITSGAGNDTLDGGAGADTLIGGLGDDVYVADNAGDVITEAAGAGTDEVRATAASYTLGANIEKLTFTGTGAFSGTGNSLDNIMTGGASADTLDGGAGNDTLTGGAGNDVYVIDSTGDLLVEVAGAGTDEVRTAFSTFSLATDFENLTFNGSGSFLGVGNAVTNVITSGAGNDILDGGTGNDTMVGGAGNDIYFVDAAGDVVTEATGAGTDEVRAVNASYVLGTNVENLTFIGSGSFAGTGNALVNIIMSGAGNDTLDGAAGADTLIGGLGNDIYVADVAGDVVTENAGEGTDELRTTLASYTLGANLEKLTFTGTGTAAFTGTGNTLDNVMSGGGGADTLDGGAGNDTLVGGAGNDIYVVDSSGDVLTEAASAGTDLVRATVASYTLGTNLENLTYTGTGNFTGTGNAAVNTLTGGAGNDTLDGAAGNDTLIGGLGNDVYIVDVAADVVTEAASAGTDELRTALTTITLAANVENLTFTGTAGFTGTGNGLDNVMSGGIGADTLSGGAGNDTLNGGVGADRLTGGTGNDAFIVDATGDVLVENASEGTDEVRTTLTTFTLATNFENLTFLGAGDFTGTGNSANNVLTGGVGNDMLSGGTGSDTMAGGLGNDIYVVDVAGDVVTETTGAGTDEVRTALTSYTLGAEVENLTFTGTGAFTGTGNAFGNVLTGAAGNDTLTGGGGDDMLVGGTGNDSMTGGTGNDIFVVDAAGDVVTENAGEGTDEVRTALTSYTLGTNVEKLTFTGTAAFTGTGNGLDNIMTGGAGSDTLNAAAGNDTLTGSGGNDGLTGGAGNDTFIFHVGFGQDTVTDFTAGAGAGDVIELHDGILGSFAAVQSAATQVGADLRIDVDASSSILLKNVALSNLNQDDFRFV
jgi:Ca2+-binding RTX toxin-like protein